MAACGTANTGGIETCTLKEYSLCRSSHTRIKTTEDTGHTFGFCSVADHQICTIERAFNPVESSEFGTGHSAAHNNLVAGKLVGIECMEWLAYSVEHEIGDVYNIIDRMQTYHLELVGKPLGAWADLYSFDCHTAITGHTGRVFNTYIYSTALGSDNIGSLGAMCFDSGDITAGESSRDVTGHTIMTACVNTVRSQVYLEYKIILDIVVLRCRTTYHGLCGSRKHDDTVVRRAYADFILGTYHTERFHSTYLRFLDLKFASVGGVEGSADGSDHNSLSGGYIGSTAYDLCRSTFAVEIDGCDMEVVAVGMGLAGENFTHHDAGKAAADSLDALYGAGLQADRGQESAKLVGRHVEIDIIFKPFI